MLLYSLEVAKAVGEGYLQHPDHPLEPLVIKGRAWPHHCDYFLHINNAEYLKLMDYGRTKYFAANRLLRPMITGDFTSLVAGTSVTYRRSIDMFRSYWLTTQLHYHDDQWAFFEQVFRDEHGHDAVRALVRVCIQKKGRRSSFAELASSVGLDVPDMLITSDVEQFEGYTRIAIEQMQA
jgi:acyl-CoA thioesterase FadM